MSAPDNAITLKAEADLHNPHWWETTDLDTWCFKCDACGYEGKAAELLVDPDGDNDTMWCPICTTAAWVWV